MIELNVKRPTEFVAALRVERLDTCCGIWEWGEFDLFDVDEDGEIWENTTEESLNLYRQDGTGMFIATFIDTPECKAAYEELCKGAKLLYQSPLRKNKGSGNDLFLCVFEHK